MERDKDNANPTILSASQLPTRQKKAAVRRGPESKFSHAVFNRHSSYLPGSMSDTSSEEESEEAFTAEPIDEQEIYDLISPISDPEHPVSLGQLSVVNLSDIHVRPSSTSAANPNALTQVLVDITPTITHCSLATVIGLGVRVRLEQALPPNFRVDIRIKEGTHSQDDQINKQLADRERVAAALENETLRGVLDKMLETCP